MVAVGLIVTGRTSHEVARTGCHSGNRMDLLLAHRVQVVQSVHWLHCPHLEDVMKMGRYVVRKGRYIHMDNLNVPKREQWGAYMMIAVFLIWAIWG
jgi:hypothetical protein